MTAAQVGSILNFSLMYFLAPTAGAKVVGANLLQKLFSEQTLLAWGAPGVLDLYNTLQLQQQLRDQTLGQPQTMLKIIRQTFLTCSNIMLWPMLCGVDIHFWVQVATCLRRVHSAWPAGQRIWLIRSVDLASDPSSASPDEERFPWQ